MPARRTTLLAAVLALGAPVALSQTPSPATPPAPNASPVVASQELAVVEDTPLDGALVATDPDGDALSFTVAATPKHGTVTLDAKTGAFTYTPAQDFHGDDAFTFAVSDGKLKATTTATIKVSAVDDAPTVKPLALTLAEDAPARATVVATDVDGDALTYALDPARAPAHGAVVVDAKTGALTYTPAADFHGADAFAIDVAAGGARAKAEVTVQITPANDPPVAQASTGSVDEDGAFKGTLAATDVDGDALSFTIAVTPKHGTVALDAQPNSGKTGAFTYTPAKDWHGEDAFTFAASDGRAKSTATASVRTLPVDDAPVARALALTLVEDAPVRATVVASDVDGDAITYALDPTRSPAHGAVVVDEKTGALTYTPAADFHGTDAFAIDVAAGGARAKAEVTVQIAPANDAPVATAADASGAEDGSVEGTLVATDVDGDALTFKVGTPPKRGGLSVDAQTGAFRYRPFKDLHGDDSFTFDASDGRAKSTATATIHVAPANDAPVARNLELATREDTAVRGTIAASDVDKDALAFRLATGPAHGEVALDEKTGAFTFTPSADRNGADAFTVEVADGTAIATASVSVTVAAVPDAPRVQEGVVVDTREDTPVSARLPAADADGDALVFKIAVPPRLGTAVIEDAATGAWRYTPRADASGLDEITFEVTGARSSSSSERARGVVKVNIAAQNDAPILTALELSTREDTSVAGALSAIDVDGDPLRYAIATGPARGRATVDGATVRYEPARDDHGDVSFTVTASDGVSTSAPANVVVHVAPTNDAPVVKNHDLTTLEDVPVAGTLVASDVDKDRLTFRVRRAPTRGKVDIINPALGSFRFAPDRNLAGPDWFTIEAVDPSGAAAVATVRVDVKAIDDPPIARAAAVLAPKSGRFTGKLDGYDPEAGTVTFRLHTPPRFGRVEITDERTGAYELITDGVVGSTFFMFTVSDGKLTSAPAKVDVTTRR